MTTEAAPRTALAPRVAAEGQIQSHTFEQMERMAQSVAKSGLFGVKTADQALALMLISQAEGRPAALAALDYHIIEGKPSLKADTLLSRFQAAGGSVRWLTYTDEKVEATFSHPQAGSVTVDWTLERAQKVKCWNNKKQTYEPLTQKLNWQNFPRSMLRARTISEGVRTCYPGVAVGIYTPQEIEDGVVEVDVTPTATVDEAVSEVASGAHPLDESERVDHLIAIRECEDIENLSHAFATAWTHATHAKDAAARAEFKAAYDARKTELEQRKEGA